MLALAACTKKQELSKVVVQLPAASVNQTKSLSSSNVQTFAPASIPTPSWGLSRPATLAEAKCFAVVVEAPDAKDTTTKKCHATDPAKSLFASHFAGLAEAART